MEKRTKTGKNVKKKVVHGLRNTVVTVPAKKKEASLWSELSILKDGEKKQLVTTSPLPDALNFLPQKPLVFDKKNLEEIFPGLTQRRAGNLEEELAPLPTPSASPENNPAPNLSAYELAKNTGGSYSLTADYFSSKSYDMSVASPDGSSGQLLRGMEQKNPLRNSFDLQETTQGNQMAKQYDSDAERDKRAKRMM
ncbi:MAG: hypothetical protein RL557_198 [archaeon]|jgi:hypothetical protein